MINHPEMEQHFLGPMLAWVGRLRGNVYGVVQTPDGMMHVLCHGLRLLQRQLLARITPALLSTKIYPILSTQIKDLALTQNSGHTEQPRCMRHWEVFHYGKALRQRIQDGSRAAGI
jgi:hypothetical protein